MESRSFLFVAHMLSDMAMEVEPKNMMVKIDGCKRWNCLR